MRQHDDTGQLRQVNHVRINNFGWVSSHQYQRQKPVSEFRIAVIGDSLTASINNNFPWPDVAQLHLNTDAELKRVLGVDHIVVLNLAVPGASMQFMVNPLAAIARRFAPDMTVVNYAAEDLARRHYGGNFLKIPSEPDQLPSDQGPPLLAGNVAATLEVEGAEINLFCPVPHAEPSNPACRVNPNWVIPTGTQLQQAETQRLKQRVASRLLLRRVILSSRPLVLMKLFNKPFVVDADTEVSVQTMATQSDDEEDDIKNGLKALHIIASMSLGDMLVTHNPLYWHLTGQNRPPVLDKFVAKAGHAGIEIVRMEEYMPTQRGEREWYRWYNLPYDGHWSDYGAEVYGKAMAQAIRERLLARRPKSASGAPAKSECAAALGAFNHGRDILSGGNTAAALAEFTQAIETILSDRRQVRMADVPYRDCGFAVDVYRERGNLFKTTGNIDRALADWQVSLSLGPDQARLYQERAEILRGRGDFAAASADFDEAIRLDLSSASLRFLRGTDRLTHGDSAGAVEDFTAGLAVEPQNAPLMYLRGSAYEAQERWADALADYTAALTAKPDYALAYQARAEVLDRLGRPAVATSDRQRASHGH